MAAGEADSPSDQHPQTKRGERYQQRIVSKGLREISMQQLVQRPLAAATGAIETGQGVKAAFWEECVLFRIILTKQKQGGGHHHAATHDYCDLLRSGPVGIPAGRIDQWRVVGGDVHGAGFFSVRDWLPPRQTG